MYTLQQFTSSTVNQGGLNHCFRPSSALITFPYQAYDSAFENAGKLSTVQYVAPFGIVRKTYVNVPKPLISSLLANNKGFYGHAYVFSMYFILVEHTGCDLQVVDNHMARTHPL
jgi:hypothetical protein